MIARLRNIGWTFYTMEPKPTMELATKLNEMNIKLGNYKASIRNGNEPMWYICV